MSRPAQWGDWDEDILDEVELEEDYAPSRLAVARALPAGRPTPGKRAAPAPQSQPRRRIRWGQLAVVGIVGYLLIIGATSEVTLMGVRRQANALGSQAATLTAANKTLQHQITLLHERRYVDELARTQLGYVSPGEVELVPKTAAHSASGSHT